MTQFGVEHLPFSIMLAIDLLWGYYAVGRGRETSPLVFDPATFLAHAAIATGILALSQRLIDWSDPAGCHPSRLALTMACSLVVGFFALLMVPTVPWAPAVIIPLLATVMLSLRRGASPWAELNVLAYVADPARARNLAGLVLIPITATGAYFALQGSGIDLPGPQIVYLVTSIIGMVFFVTTVFRLFRRGRLAVARPLFANPGALADVH
jgi:hypothetical protein